MRGLYVDYLSQYMACLAETEVDKLDALWCTLDEKWMQIRYPIQIVHDIECVRATQVHSCCPLTHLLLKCISSMK